MYIYAMYIALIITFVRVSTVSSIGNRTTLYLSESNENLKVKRAVDKTDCGAHEHLCDSGECIQKVKVCDSVLDCSDGSDESLKHCADVICGRSTFKCSYGACIDNSKRCDGEIDCAVDQSDESQSTCGILNKQPTCNPGEFTCGTRTCVPNTSVCDGKPDCSDASDESTHCLPNVCDSNQFRCNYGACIAESQICDGKRDCYDGSDESALCRYKVTPAPVVTEGCVLPTIANGNAYPANTHNKGRVIPVSEWVIYECLRPYVLQPPDRLATCLANFSWTHVPTCNIACPEISSLSLNIQYSGDPKKGDVLKPSTLATLSCKQYYAPPKSYTGSFTAECLRNGQWSIPIFNCVAKCGRETTNSGPLIINGTNTTTQNVPWNVGVYRRFKTKENTTIIAPEHICGGTIIREMLILSAAHCFWNESSKGVNTAIYEYYVGAGKVMRDYNSQEDYRQRQQVHEIIVHTDFKGKEKSYINDIAMLVLKFNHAFILGNGVQPACIDWSNQFEDDAFRNGSYGHISGWGLTSSNGKPSDVLKRISLPYLTMRDCEQKVPIDFIGELLHDKVCVGGTDYMGVCEGDSGSGLMFKANNKLWYVRGIVSISPIYLDSCHPNSPTAYTKLSFFFTTWLTPIFTKYDNAFYRNS